MIYPDVTLDEWLKKNPVLEVQTEKCPHCSKKMITNIPFIDKNWIGIQSSDCSCGKGKGISVATPRPNTEAEFALHSLFS